MRAHTKYWKDVLVETAAMKAALRANGVALPEHPPRLPAPNFYDPVYGGVAREIGR